MNELLSILGLILVFSTVVLFSKLFGKDGMVAWVSIATILANIAVTKQITLFGINIALGNILFASTFLCTDIISEVYGTEMSKKAVNIGICSALVFIFVSQLLLLFVPNENDIVNESMKNLFTFSFRTTLSSVIMFYIANIADVYLFDFIKKRVPNKLWLRNNVCTIVCNCTENFGFSILAFLGMYSIKGCLSIAIAGTVVEIIIALLDTPFAYLGRKVAKKN